MLKGILSFIVVGCLIFYKVEFTEQSTQLELTSTLEETKSALTPHCQSDAECIDAVGKHAPTCFAEKTRFSHTYLKNKYDPADIALCINGKGEGLYFSVSEGQ